MLQVYNLYGLDTVWSETLEFSKSGFVKPSVDGGAGVALFQDQDNGEIGGEDVLLMISTQNNRK